MTTTQIRSFLTALVNDANDALRYVADGKYNMALETMGCAGPDVMNILAGLEELAAEKSGGCCNDVCGQCSALDASEYR
jgi:hypothetical protein